MHLFVGRREYTGGETTLRANKEETRPTHQRRSAAIRDTSGRCAPSRALVACYTHVSSHSKIYIECFDAEPTELTVK
jgi:hypothetical protein